MGWSGALTWGPTGAPLGPYWGPIGGAYWASGPLGAGDVQDKSAIIERRMEAFVQAGKETQRHLASIWSDYSLELGEGCLRWTCRLVIEEFVQWRAARKRMRECDSLPAFAVLLRAAREQVVGFPQATGPGFAPGSPGPEGPGTGPRARGPRLGAGAPGPGPRNHGTACRGMFFGEARGVSDNIFRLPEGFGGRVPGPFGARGPGPTDGRRRVFWRPSVGPFGALGPGPPSPGNLWELTERGSSVASACLRRSGQVLAQLKVDAMQAVQDCQYMQQHGVEEMVREVERINGVYQNVVHFDAWSPFLHGAVGHPAGAAAGCSIHEAMRLAEEQWQQGLAPNRAVGLFRNAAGNVPNADYEELTLYSCAVNFQSMQLPEPYKGDWSSEKEHMEAVKLIEPVGAEALELATNTQRLQYLG